MSKKNMDALVNQIIEKIGGKDNIYNVTHCMTRLRFNLKDASIVDDQEMKQIKGVIGTVQSAGQYQIIIGQTVDEVYQKVTQAIGFSDDMSSAEEKQKEPFSLKKIGNKILDGLSGSLTPLIPVLVAASMFKMVVAVLGPDMLGLLTDTSDLYVLLTFVGDAGFYFFPILVGYTAGKKFGVTPVLSMFLGAILLHPTLLQLANEGASFTVYGIPAQPENYANTIIPVIMSAWVMSYVEKFFNRVLPTAIRTVFAPALTIAVMLPITLVVLGPAGFVLGDFIGNALLSLDNVGGFLAVAIIAALWELLVMTGMHLLMITTLITVFSMNGQEAIVNPAACIASISVAGMCLGAFFKMKNKEDKALSFSYFVASFIGGVAEPGLYGIGIRYRRPYIALVIGSFLGGLYAGITGVITHTLIPVGSVLTLSSFLGGTTTNLINGILSCFIGFSISAVGTYIIGFSTEEQGETLSLESEME